MLQSLCTKKTKSTRLPCQVTVYTYPSTHDPDLRLTYSIATSILLPALSALVGYNAIDIFGIVS